MKNAILRLVASRRAMTAFYAITSLTIIGIVNKADTSTAIAAIAVGLAGANSYQKSKGNGDQK